MMDDFYKRLTTGEGYVILEKYIPENLIEAFNDRLKDLYPVRASSSTKQYAERDDIQNLDDINIWWSQEVSEFPEVIEIRKLVNEVILDDFKNLQFYASDCVFIRAKSTWINPHVDTPHRFTKWNFDKNLLGIQSIVSLHDLNSENGSTGLVPYSQKRDFDINKCYNGTYDRWFTQNAKQYEMPKGSLLFYNCRLLHSSMPNNSDIERPALLFNYLDHSILKEVEAIDNIWSSNGKRS